MLKRLPLEEREEAYLWIIYQAVHPNAGLLLPPEGKEHYFPKFMYDKLGSKPLGRVAACYAPRRSSYSPEGLRVFHGHPFLMPIGNTTPPALGSFTQPALMKISTRTAKLMMTTSVVLLLTASLIATSAYPQSCFRGSFFHLKIHLLESLPCITPLLLGRLASHLEPECGLMGLAMI